jgi:hypothetical protein
LPRLPYWCATAIGMVDRDPESWRQHLRQGSKPEGRRREAAPFTRARRRRRTPNRLFEALAKVEEEGGHIRSDNYLGRSYCLTEECSRGGSCCLMKEAPIASWLHVLSSLLWRFLLFDRAAGFLPPRPQIRPKICGDGAASYCNLWRFRSASVDYGYGYSNQRRNQGRSGARIHKRPAGRTGQTTPRNRLMRASTSWRGRPKRMRLVSTRRWTLCRRAGGTLWRASRVGEVGAPFRNSRAQAAKFGRSRRGSELPRPICWEGSRRPRRRPGRRSSSRHSRTRRNAIGRGSVQGTDATTSTSGQTCEPPTE